jgi:large subunit ribosomal protein L31
MNGRKIRRFSYFLTFCWQLAAVTLLLHRNFLISTAKSVQPLNQTFMKQDIHPKSYRLVVFKDMSNGHSFLSRSTAASKETIKWEDGNEYPLVKLEISNTSHPFFTGKNMLVDTAGRIDKFKRKYEKKK